MPLNQIVIVTWARTTEFFYFFFSFSTIFLEKGLTLKTFNSHFCGNILIVNSDCCMSYEYANANHCWVMFQKFVDNAQHCFAFTPQANFP